MANDPNRCLHCKLHKNNPLTATSVCKHEYDTDPVEKPKQKPKEVWLPHCPFCGNKVELPQGSVDGNMMVNSCQFIADTDVCIFCRVCRLHMHLDKRKPGDKHGV